MTTLNNELAAVEAEIARLTVIRDWLRARTNGAQPQPTGRITAAQAAEAALHAHGGPMRTTDLLAEVQARGAKMKDVDGLYKTLDRDRTRFRKAGRGLWELVS